MNDNDNTMVEPVSSPTVGALDRSKRKAANELQGPVSKRPSIEHNYGTRKEPKPSPTSIPLRRSKRKIPQQPVFKQPLMYNGADDQQTNAASSCTHRAKKIAAKRKAAPKARVPRQNNNATTQAPAAADGDRPARASAPRKRGRAPNDHDDDEDRPRPRKKGRPQGPAPDPPERVVINEAPTQVLGLFVWGIGKYGELGLGSTRPYCRECKEPRRNFNMSGNGPGIVHIAAGSFHAAALTKDNRILTWGQSERGQLGRDSAWKGPLTQSGLNPREANGLPVSPDSFPPNTVFTQLACGEGTTFALTNTGDVYGWGSFRIFEREEVANGEYVETDLHKQFSEGVAIQHRPVKISGRLKNIKKIVCGDNHVLALDTKGELYVWGFGDFGQLGYRWSTRVPSYRCLTPSRFRLRRHKFVNIGSGSFHSFGIQEDGVVWGWGSNLYGEAGQETGRIDDIGDGFSIPAVPRIISAFNVGDDSVTDITGGEHHSIARTRMGDCLVWGLGQNGQLAFEMSRIDPDRNPVIIDPIDDEPTGLAAPCAVNRFLGKNSPDVGIVASGRFHSMAITEDGRLFRWGNNAGWQCGVEKRPDDPVEEQNNVFRPVRIEGALDYYQRAWVYVGGGHGYSIAAHATDEFFPGTPRTPGRNGRTGLSPAGEKLPWYLSMPSPRT